MKESLANFSIGQRVYHNLFGYRGVIVDVDPVFQESDDWYEQVAKSRPPKDKPWYRVLVHDSGVDTYVAERHLQEDGSEDPVEHPLVDLYFAGFRDGTYIPAKPAN